MNALLLLTVLLYSCTTSSAADVFDGPRVYVENDTREPLFVTIVLTKSHKQLYTDTKGNYPLITGSKANPEERLQEIRIELLYPGIGTELHNYSIDLIKWAHGAQRDLLASSSPSALRNTLALYNIPIQKEVFVYNVGSTKKKVFIGSRAGRLQFFSSRNEALKFSRLSFPSEEALSHHQMLSKPYKAQGLFSLRKEELPKPRPLYKR